MEQKDDVQSKQQTTTTADVQQNTTNQADEQPQMSKKQMKRQKKQQEWEAKKDEIKAQQKAKRKEKKKTILVPLDDLNDEQKQDSDQIQAIKEIDGKKYIEKQVSMNHKSRASIAHLSRFNLFKNNPADGGEKGSGNGLRKQDKKKLFDELCKKGPKIIIDCEFNDLMEPREQLSLSQQLSYIHSINKRMEHPCDIYISGVSKGQKIQEKLDQASAQNWAMNFIKNDAQNNIVQNEIQTDQNSKEENITNKEDEKERPIDKAMKVAQNTYYDYFKNDKELSLCYLTADSPNILNELDPSGKTAYIIGGIVDRNRYQRLTLDKAEKQNISHGKLPIGDHLQLITSTVLTVNQVYEIIAEWYEQKDWVKALTKVIPERKILNEKNQQKIKDAQQKKMLQKRDAKEKDKIDGDDKQLVDFDPAIKKQKSNEKE